MNMAFLILALVVVSAAAQRRPPNYSMDDMPETSFDCRDKILGGYYADPETDCQMFHVCVKVPGVGLQNYRFLCPNDTTFDQENQICANWYDIDCEASTLFYSDNFDLYRIGYEPGSSSLPVSRATAIPLGPSSARPPNRPRNRPREEEVDYLQRSETGDARRQGDLLKGSSSGNFFSNKRGQDEDEEDRAKVTGKKKVAVRKLRKRPQESGDFTTLQDQSFSTAAPPTSRNSNGYLPRYNTIQRGGSNGAVSSTQAPFTDNNEYNTYQANNYNNQRNNFASRPSTYNAATATEASTVNNYNNQRNNFASRPSTYNAATATEASTINNYNNQRNNFASRPSTYNAATATEASTINNNYNNQRNNFAQKSSTYNTATPTEASTINNNYNNQRNNFAPRSSTYNAPTPTEASTANNYNNQRNNFAQRSSTYNAATPTEASTANNYNNQRNNFAQRSSTYNAPTPTEVPTVNNNYNNQRNNFVQRTSTYNAPSPTEASTNYNTQNYNSPDPSTSGSSEEYNKFRGDRYDYQRTENGADNEESLKTAPSTNYRPSNYNSFQNNYNTKYYNTTNNYENSVTPKTYSSSQQTTASQSYSSTTNSRASTFNAFQNNYNYNNNKNSSSSNNENNNVTPKTYSSSQQTTANTNYFFQPSTPKPFSAQSYNTAPQVTTLRPPQLSASTTPPPPKGDVKSPKKTDAAYDYAYYDEKEPEYEGSDPVSDHHFGVGGESLKVARSAAA